MYEYQQIMSTRLSAVGNLLSSHALLRNFAEREALKFAGRGQGHVIDEKHAARTFIDRQIVNDLLLQFRFKPFFIFLNPPAPP